MVLFPLIEAKFSAERLSDHSPCSIQMMPDNGVKRKTRFQYCNIWSAHDDFRNIMQSVWGRNIRGSTMYQILKNLKMLRVELRPLKRHFLGAMQKVKSLREALTQAQDDLALNPQDNALQDRERDIKLEFLHWSRVAASIMSQRTKEEWLLRGDANTRLFHQSLRLHHYKSRIYRVTDASGTLIADPDQVKEHFR